MRIMITSMTVQKEEKRKIADLASKEEKNPDSSLCMSEANSYTYLKVNRCISKKYVRLTAKNNRL